MHTINISYDPDKREISSTGGYAGTTIDNASTEIVVTGIPEEYTGRLEFRVTVKDVNGRNVRPYLDLEGGRCTLTDVILDACRRDNKLPAQLVLTRGTEVIASRNIIIFTVAPSIDSWGAFVGAYRTIWDEAIVDVTQDVPGKLSFESIGRSIKTIDIDISQKDLPVGNLVGVIDPVHIPPVAFERCAVVPDDQARFALTSADVQNGDTVKVSSTDLMYMVVDDTNLNSEAGYMVYRSMVPWGSVSGDIVDQQDLQGQMHTKADVAEGVNPWRSSLTYPSGAITKIGGTLYVSLIGGNYNHDPQNDDQAHPVFWRAYSPIGGVSTQPSDVMIFTLGNGVDREYTITHSLNSYDVFAFLYPDSGSRATQLVTCARPNVNQVTLFFSDPVAVNSVKAVVFRPGTSVLSVNGKTGVVVLGPGDVGAVPITRTINGHEMSEDIMLDKGDVGLGMVDNTPDSAKMVSGPQQAALDTKVDKVPGHGLSQNSYSDGDVAKLASIDYSAQRNVQSDWSATSGDAFVKNKPYIISREDGIVPWSPDLKYNSGSITNVGGVLYKSLVSNNYNHNPPLSPAFWAEYTPAQPSQIATPVNTYVANIGDGTSDQITVTHSLNSYDVVVVLVDLVNGHGRMDARFERPNVNQVTLFFSSAPATGSLRVLIYRPGDVVSFFRASIVGDGVQKTFVVAHNLGKLPAVQLYDPDGHAMGTTMDVTSTDVTLTFFKAPGSGDKYDIVVIA
ncbi:MAG: hypothetical protein RBR71_12660 [Gudongella sp.]|nr:hypothetical protein [Gudongella sp.]